MVPIPCWTPMPFRPLFQIFEAAENDLAQKRLKIMKFIAGGHGFHADECASTKP